MHTLSIPTSPCSTSEARSRVGAKGHIRVTTATRGPNAWRPAGASMISELRDGSAADDLLSLGLGVIDFDLQLMHAIHVAVGNRIIPVSVEFEKLVADVINERAFLRCEHDRLLASGRSVSNTGGRHSFLTGGTGRVSLRRAF